MKPFFLLLINKKLAREGLEPPILELLTQRSNQLSYLVKEKNEL